MALSGVPVNVGSIFLLLLIVSGCSARYYGKFVGQLNEYAHEVSGVLYVVNYTHLFIKDFTYDGKGPDAFFWIGTSDRPSASGIIVPDEHGTTNVLRKYNKEDILLTLPPSIDVGAFRWFSVWCRQFRANFADIYIPSNIDVPNPRAVGEFSRLAHGLKSSQVIFETDRVVLINNLYYDGYGPDAFFILGNGTVVGATRDNPKYIKIPDETGSLEKAHRYNNNSIRIKVPEGYSLIEHDYLAMFCILANQNFGHINISGNPNWPLNIPPHFDPPVLPTQPPVQEWDSTLANCEQVHEKLNIGWEVKDNMIEVELISSTLDDEYVAFGLSGATDRVSMINADVTVTYFDTQARAVDHFLGAYSQCSNGQGACADTARSGRNDATVLAGSKTNGITKIKYSRSLNTGDNNDKVYLPDTDQYIAWAIGFLNQERFVTKHHTRITDLNTKWRFGRTPAKNCRPLQVAPTAPPRPALPANQISGSDTKTFEVVLGPTGGVRGYQGITGQVSWGIAFYVNDLLIPELTLRRGDTYTFKIRTGADPSNSARFHPVYLTDDPVGGYVQRSPQENQMYQVFGGIDQELPAIGTLGTYCEYQERDKINPDDYSTFADYFTQLDLVCDQGSLIGEFTFTPDQNTPDLIYYQCFTHNRLGWKIHIVDEYPNVSPPTGNLQNCETLSEKLEIIWTKVNDTHLSFTMNGMIAPDEYMAFGISGSENAIQMINADVTVASYDDVTGPSAVDYFLSQKSRCTGTQGVCPDTDTGGRNDVTLLGGSRNNGMTTIGFVRKLDTGDTKDKVYLLTENSIVWAIGKRDSNGKPTYHSMRIPSLKKIAFGRTPQYNCVAPTLPPVSTEGWPANTIDGTEVNEFTVRIGPTGGDKGYKFITGQQSWGIAYYINELLIPELTLVRGRTYTFKIEAGDDLSNYARYHPFYLTTDPRGGYSQLNTTEKQAHKVFLGIGVDGMPVGGAVGKYCEYKPGDVDTVPTSATFEDYFNTLSLDCPTAGATGNMVWTPDQYTPDLIYYQCYTHFRLGWKIHIVDDPTVMPEPEPPSTVATKETIVSASDRCSLHTITFITVFIAVLNVIL